jgi:hypothetical protein
VDRTIGSPSAAAFEAIFAVQNQASFGIARPVDQKDMVALQLCNLSKTVDKVFRVEASTKISEEPVLRNKTPSHVKLSKAHRTSEAKGISLVDPASWKALFIEYCYEAHYIKLKSNTTSRLCQLNNHNSVTPKMSAPPIR